MIEKNSISFIQETLLGNKFSPCHSGTFPDLLLTLSSRPQICVGLNNIERVRRELTGLPSHFGFEALLEDVRSAGSGSAAASQLKETVERLISSATENMEGKVNEFIEAVMEKVR